jgi:2-C-methyl-D-erythritol 4-phosphate cytidylyltransferase
VAATEPRDNLWLAQTPQMFRYRLLIEALRAADPARVTDEASAIEGLGLKPRLVMGDSRNIKVTFPEDLAIAELILRGRDGKTAKMRLKKKNNTEPPRRQDAKKKIKTRTKRK